MFPCCLPLFKERVSSVPTAAYIGFHFPFIFLTHLSGHLAYLQSLVIISLSFFSFFALSGLSLTWTTVNKFFYTFHKHLHTSLSLCWSHHSDTYAKYARIYMCLIFLVNLLSKRSIYYQSIVKIPFLTTIRWRTFFFLKLVMTDFG